LTIKETLGWVDVAPVPVEAKSAKKRRLQEIAKAAFAEAEAMSDEEEEEGEEEVLAPPSEPNTITRFSPTLVDNLVHRLPNLSTCQTFLNRVD
jgi:hypothetical protein